MINPYESPNYCEDSPCRLTARDYVTLIWLLLSVVMLCGAIAIHHNRFYPFMGESEKGIAELSWMLLFAIWLPLTCLELGRNNR